MERPLTSEMLPVSFRYPATREHSDLERFEYFGPCVGPREVFSWEYSEVLKDAGAASEVVNFKFDYSSLDQSNQQPMVKRRNAYLNKALGSVIKHFYKGLLSQGITLSTSSQTLPDNMGELKTWENNDTNATIVYKGSYYGSYFKDYSFPGSSYPDVFALTLCQVSGPNR